MIWAMSGWPPFRPGGRQPCWCRCQWRCWRCWRKWHKCGIKTWIWKILLRQSYLKFPAPWENMQEPSLDQQPPWKKNGLWLCLGAVHKWHHHSEGGDDETGVCQGKMTKQDHLRMNNSTGSNNHLQSIDLFRSMIIKKNKSKVRDRHWIVIE